MEQAKKQPNLFVTILPIFGCKIYNINIQMQILYFCYVIKLGDTIYGYVTYQGLEQSKKKHWAKLNIYFKCLLGVSRNPNDYIDTYERCDPPRSQ